MLKLRLSLILPAYNESRDIEKNIAECCETLSSLGYDYEILVVDDGSSDYTYARAADASSKAQGRVRVIRYERNSGKGNALICGSAYATGDIVVFVDADLELHPRQLPALITTMTRGDYDAVIGSKLHPLSDVQYPMVRRVYSFFYYLLIRALFGLPIKDSQTGLKIFRRDLLVDVLPRMLSKRFAFDIELLAIAYARGYKLSDAPITMRYLRGFGRIGPRDIVQILTDTMAIFYRSKIIHYYDHVDASLDELECVRVSREICQQEAYP